VEAQLTLSLGLNISLMMIHVKIFMRYRRTKGVVKNCCGIPEMHEPYYDPNLNMLSLIIFTCEVLFLVVGILTHKKYMTAESCVWSLFAVLVFVVLYFLVVFRRPACNFAALKGHYAEYEAALEEDLREQSELPEEERCGVGSATAGR